MFVDVCDLTHVAKSAQRKNRRSVTINMTGLQRGLQRWGSSFQPNQLRLKAHSTNYRIIHITDTHTIFIHASEETHLQGIKYQNHSKQNNNFKTT